MEDNSPEEGKTSKIQRLVMDYLEGVIDSSRDFEEKTGISHAMYHRYKDMKSMMTLNKLEHIFSIYPSLRAQVGDHLRGNTEKKLTNDGKTALSKDDELFQLYKDNYIQAKALISELQDKIKDLEHRLGDSKKDKARPAHN